jgi:hypothetical protein
MVPITERRQSFDGASVREGDRRTKGSLAALVGQAPAAVTSLVMDRDDAAALRAGVFLTLSIEEFCQSRGSDLFEILYHAHAVLLPIASIQMRQLLARVRAAIAAVVDFSFGEFENPPARRPHQGTPSVLRTAALTIDYTFGTWDFVDECKISSAHGAVDSAWSDKLRMDGFV